MKYSNSSVASIPLALVDGLQSGKTKSTDRLLLVSFGAGLTWAAAVVQYAPSGTTSKERVGQLLSAPTMGD